LRFAGAFFISLLARLQLATGVLKGLGRPSLYANSWAFLGLGCWHNVMVAGKPARLQEKFS